MESGSRALFIFILSFMSGVGFETWGSPCPSANDITTMALMRSAYSVLLGNNGCKLTLMAFGGRLSS